jgi:phosphoribosylaminoimidazole-succinocarboxamide synthase
MDPEVILTTNFSSLKLFKRGKVRDVYSIGEYYLIVSTDRLSAFDVIMTQGIPYKGKVLTKISEFWFNCVKHIIPNHLVSTSVDEFPAECGQYKNFLEGRSMLVKKADVIPIECIVRGYISGSGWNDYKHTKKISGIKLRDGLVESEKFDEPIFTPSTKAEIGLHDENISFEQAEKAVGADIITKLRNISLEVYKTASEFALSKGIIIADTKMEFGVDENGELILIDELLTPDSSRFWLKDQYQPGRGQESFDKQFVRNYLLSINFNKKPPAPKLPDEVILKTSALYLEALNRLSGRTLV